MAGPLLTVLHLSWSLMTGGLERVVLDLARGMPGQGCRPVVAALEKAGAVAERVQALGVPFHLLGKRPGVDLRVVPRLARLIGRERVDVIHAHNQAAAFYGGLAGLLTRRPLLTTRHGASFGKDYSHRWLTRAGALMSRCTVCVGQDAWRVARERDRTPARRLRLIYNGVDTEAFRPDDRGRAAARAELGIPATAPVVISVGRLSAEKDYPTLLKALALAHAGQADARLILAGDGPERPGLERLGRELGLGPRLLLLGERADVARLLAAADVFALSSLSEGVSISLLEAMAAGLAVAATGVGGTLEVVTPGETGLLVAPGDPGALAQALDGLLADPGRRADLGAAARARVRAQFSLAGMVAAYVDLYRELAAPRRTS